MVTNNITIKELFHSLQTQLSVGLNTGRQNVTHPSTLGDVSEGKWREWLSDYLPKRYAVEKGFIIDSNGNMSEQIDIIIYDRQYSPLIFSEREVKYIPVESVYCVFEVKQKMNKSHIEYAVKKAESVDVLHKTSSSIQAVTGQHVKEPFNVLRGILTTDSEWIGGNNSPAFRSLLEKNHLDLGCSINDRSFSKEDGSIKISEIDESLVFFFLKLLNLLAKKGTVPALSIEVYAQALDSEF